MARRQPAVTYKGLRGFSRQLADLDDDLKRDLKAKLKELGERTAEDARGRAYVQGRPQQRAAAWGITAESTAAASKLRVSTAGEKPFALGAFFGSNRPQFPGLPWVGASWDAGVEGEGPYHLNPALAATADKVEEELAEIVESLALKSRAFPDLPGVGGAFF